MIVEGRAIAERILVDVAAVVAARPSGAPRLTAITCAPNFETQRYLAMKKEKAAQVGIALNVVELPATVTTDDVIACVSRVAPEADGVVVQLPLPVQVDMQAVLATVPVEKDPDGFVFGHDPAACLSPVVGAIDEISKQHQVEWVGKQVVVLGEGRLVGAPAAAYARQAGAEVTVLNKDTFDPHVLQQADIIVSGVGKPQFITPDMIKAGVIIFDAGTSEDGGELVGDVHRDVYPQAALVTPVPGGIGPITIAYLLHNLVSLSGEKVKKAENT
ncbi:MAG: bifunctional 5,10-methylenetetrahydrofolate dehydrogenase/5,10-methenyltetrahydrofolate cyclohydrolase [Candidatus Kaiserbacteria bacterium]|nr:bifunctional 5,10-methylenetetrahydrofolate dehydrogenase/5,10-methenyltetrahydrofolate cyclohydrolase [Candidatus Kaiserbacteria bacterium]MCB9816338.1 bifunctional 5,10-methylenetetrahydrofolate dehydrogenase/5,10-methenyltetrahydrofolate cyclohydrolase [Candidatus Nomurabacteria bacterium]